MMSGGSGARIQMFTMQPDALVNMSGGTPPVSGTKYEWSTDGSVANAIGTQKNVRVLGIYISCTWTVQPTPLELHITVDGISYLFSIVNPVSGTPYYPRVSSSSAANAQALTTTDVIYSLGSASLMDGCSIKIEAEITGGTVQALNMRVKWAKVL